MQRSGFQILTLLLAASVTVRAADSALVPLETESTDIEEALLNIEQGRFREGIEVLQSALSEEARLSDRSGLLLQVPQDLPRDAAKLREALRAISSAPARGAPAPDAEQAPGDPLRPAPPRPLDKLGPGQLPWPRVVQRPRPPIGAREATTNSPGRRFLPRPALALAALVSLPPEGIRIYRELYDVLAQKLLSAYREHNDTAFLERTVRELFLTSSGDDAAEILGDRLAEEASYRAALGWWRRILDEYPGTDIPGTRLREKILQALRLLGDEKEYVLERERLAGAGSGELGFIESLEKSTRFVSSRDRKPTEPSSRWGGELSELVAPAMPAGELRLSWDSWVWSGEGISSESGRSALRRGGFNQWQVEPVVPYYPFLPLADGGSLYVSGVFTVFKLDSRPGGGSLTGRYRKPIPSGEAFRYVEHASYDSPLYSLTLWKKAADPAWSDPRLPDDILVTQYISDRVPPRDFMGYAITVELPIRSLVAFDAAGGGMLWKSGVDKRKTVDGRSVPAGQGGVAGGAARPRRDGAEEDSDDDEWMDAVEPDVGAVVRRPGRVHGAPSLDDDETSRDRDFSYTSPAIVKAGRVVAGGWVQRGYVNSALRCLDLRTGELLWETLLSGFQVEPTMFGEMAREPFSGAILEDDGTVYYVDQGGVAAAVELETGHVKWLTTYDMIEVEATLSPTPTLRKLCWGPNPLLLVGNVLIVAPRDSEYLYAIDTGTGPDGERGGGRILWRYWNALGIQGQAELRDLLGFHKGLLYFTGPGEMQNGPGVVAALDLTSLDAFGRLPGGGPPLKLAPLRVQGTIPGPGALTSGGVLFSDEEGLQLASLDLNEVRPVSPRPYRQSQGRTYPGRLQVVDGLVIMTSRELISVYAPLPAAESR